MVCLFHCKIGSEGHSERGAALGIHLHNRAIVRHWFEELPVVVPLVRTILARATTTPKVRAAIQASVEAASVLAERFGTTEQTVYKWKHRIRCMTAATRRTGSRPH